MNRTIQATALAWLLGMAVCPAFSEQPVGWRGDGTGKFAGVTPPSEWSSSKNVLWKVSLPGSSYAAPIVVGEHLYVVSDPSDVLCIHRATGKVVWKESIKDIKAGAGGGKRPFGKGGFGKGKFGKGGFGKGGGMGGMSAGNSAATPVSDGKHVVTVFGNGVVAVYTTKGKRLWGKFVESAQIGFGHAASPLLLDGKVIVHFRDLVALDVNTGKELWRASLSASHASPIATRLGKDDLIISPAGAIVRARDGKVVARGSFRTSDNSPILAGDIFCVNGNSGISAFKLSSDRGEVKLTSLWTARSSGSGGGGGDRRLPSAVLHDGLLYTATSGGILEVTDVKTGKQVYRQRLPVRQVYSSITLAGNLLYVMDLQGSTVVFKPGRRFERVATNRLEGTGSCPVFAGDHLYVRGRSNLYCVSAGK